MQTETGDGSMILKNNIDELPGLIKRAKEELSPVRHELRTPYYFKSSKEQMDIAEAEMLPRKALKTAASTA